MRNQWQFAVVMLAAWQAVWAAATPQALTETGALSGLLQGEVAVYRGVPFAAPPVGDLRWRPPVAPAAWTGIRKAEVFAPACMQEGVSMPGETPPATSEDCLYLNIWTPANMRRQVDQYWCGLRWRLRNGSAAMPLYWGEQFARKGLIVVTIAYRYGPLGFLALRN